MELSFHWQSRLSVGRFLFYRLRNLFLHFSCIMAKHLCSVRDRNGFLADRELFDRPGTESVVGDEGMIHGVNFVLLAASS